MLLGEVQGNLTIIFKPPFKNMDIPVVYCSSRSVDFVREIYRAAMYHDKTAFRCTFYITRDFHFFLKRSILQPFGKCCGGGRAEQDLSSGGNLALSMLQRIALGLFRSGREGGSKKL